MRNNEERFGAKDVESSPAPALAATESSNNNSNPLQFVTPTEFVELPSKGEYYLEGHALYKQNNIEIRHMTAKDEDILTSTTLLKQGIAIERMLQNIIVNKAIRIDDLLAGDKNAIVVAARVSAYGSNYTTRVQCPICTNYSEHEFNLGSYEMTHTNEYLDKEQDIEKTQNNTFILTLPVTKNKVEIKLLTTMEENQLLSVADKRRKLKLPEANATEQVKAFVVSIDGHTDSMSLTQFIENMPARDSRHLRNTYVKLAPNIDLTQQFICLNCNSEVEMEVPFTADFFWPR